MRMVTKTMMVMSRMVMMVMVMMTMMVGMVRMMIMHLFSFTVSRAGDLSCVMSPASVH